MKRKKWAVVIKGREKEKLFPCLVSESNVKVTPGCTSVSDPGFSREPDWLVLVAVMMIYCPPALSLAKSLICVISCMQYTNH